ncbi:MAG: VOC family protein [Alphaproteobacteria bacterium]|jgi:catechol 2,3-dioxygenase-like lactoylglutathione lyase family enzyme|nr:VOC family protein [Alphaproteobacteria bacterium]
MILSIDHIVITVSDMKKTIHFYSDILGMEINQFYSKSDNTYRKSLKFGKQKINLHEASNPYKPNAEVALPGTLDICFLTDEPLSHWIKIFNKNNVTIESGPILKTGAIGPIESIYVRDPDKNLIEISNQIIN